MIRIAFGTAFGTAPRAAAPRALQHHTPLHAAAHALDILFGQGYVKQLLKEKRASVNCYTGLFPPLTIAAKNGHSEIVQVCNFNKQYSHATSKSDKI